MGGVEDIKGTSLVCPLALVGLGHNISSLSVMMQPVQFSASHHVCYAGKTFDAITKSTTAILVHDSNFKEIMNTLTILCQHMFAACVYQTGYVLLCM